jgi:hypothetical protein
MLPHAFLYLHQRGCLGSDCANQLNDSKSLNRNLPLVSQQNPPNHKAKPMPRYLISFDDGSMNHIPKEDWQAVGEASHAVVHEAKAAGVWIWGGGVERQKAAIVATDGAVTEGPFPETKPVIGGFSIFEVPSREEALTWAAKIAKACRCAQEVREIMYDPES